MKKSLCLALIIMFIATLCGLGLAASSTVKDGTYNVTSTGMYDGINLEVTFKAGKIVGVKVISHNETKGISDLPIEKIPAAIVATNSIAVDSISGATKTTEGIINGVIAAILAAGGNVEDFSVAVEQRETAKEIVELKTEVVVVGAGMAGLTTALSAADNGMDVILLEKLPFTGGSLAVAGGYFISVNSPVYARFLPTAPADDLENALAYFLGLTKNSPTASAKYPNVEKLERHYAGIGATHAFLEKQGIIWKAAVPANPGLSLGLVVADGGGMGAAQALTATVRANEKIDLFVQTPATDLITENGKVVGVIAESSNTIYKIKADHVVLATGGFASNPDLIAQYVPAYIGTVNTASAGNTGDGLSMAQKVGAKIFDEHWMVTAYPSPTQEFKDLNTKAGTLAIGNRILVNEAGDRFVNEAANFTLVTNAIAYNETKTYAIFDATNEAFVEIMETGLNGGNVFKGQTIEELASTSGINAKGLAATIASYQKYAAEKSDPEFNKAAASLVGYAENGPYYAVEYNHSVWGSMSGVMTTDNYQVLNEQGEIIEGLYAIGEMNNKDFYHQNYAGASSLSLYSTMGRLLGEFLAK